MTDIQSVRCSPPLHQGAVTLSIPFSREIEAYHIFRPRSDFGYVNIFRLGEKSWVGSGFSRSDMEYNLKCRPLFIITNTSYCHVNKGRTPAGVMCLQRYFQYLLEKFKNLCHAFQNRIDSNLEFLSLLLWSAFLVFASLQAKTQKHPPFCYGGYASYNADQKRLRILSGEQESQGLTLNRIGYIRV